MIWHQPEQSPPAAPPVVAEGIFAETLVATPGAWVAAGNLQPGDLVLTFDNGPQPLQAVSTAAFHEGPARLWPLRVPAWALDNRDEILLLPEQRLLLESDMAETLFGDPFAMIPAAALEMWRGIARFRPGAASQVVQLHFARPEILYASRGILLSCAGSELGPDPGTGDRWEELWGVAAGERWGDPGHTACTLAQARHLVACLMAEDAGAALPFGGRHRVLQS